MNDEFASQILKLVPSVVLFKILILRSENIHHSSFIIKYLSFCLGVFAT